MIDGGILSERELSVYKAEQSMSVSLKAGNLI